MAIEKEVLDQLLAGYDPPDVFGKGGLVDELKKVLSERILNAEIDDHLAGESTAGESNHRNGYSSKSVSARDGAPTTPWLRRGGTLPRVMGSWWTWIWRNSSTGSITTFSWLVWHDALVIN